MIKPFLQQLAVATNWPILLATAVLSGIGICSIWAESPDKGLRQLIYLCISLVVLLLMQTVSYNAIGRYSWAFYVLSLLLVLYTVAGSKFPLPGVTYTKGAYAWINLGVTTLEPSELMKISFVLTLARYLRFRSNYRTLAGLVPPFLLAFVPIALILKQPDLGVAALFVPTLLAMLFVAGVRVKHVALILSAGAVLVPIFWLSGTDRPGFRHMPALVQSYQRKRLEAMFSTDPRTLREKGYQQERALAAQGSGGVLGKGPGNLTVGRHVPEGYNDMIFAIVGEQFGFVGSLIVLFAYLVLFVTGVEISASTREPFGKLVALGLVVLLASQAFLNLMVTMRLFPVTGVTLPFVSFGGTSLLASFVAAGLLLNIGTSQPLVLARNAFEFD